MRHAPPLAIDPCAHHRSRGVLAHVLQHSTFSPKGDTLMKTFHWLAIGVVAPLTACGTEHSPPPQAPAGAVLPAPVTRAPTTSNAPSATSSQVSIDENIRTACGLSRAEAYFAYDSAKLQPRAEQVFEKLARCFISGPMKGQEMLLVGRADPRGGEEYNFVLGDHRAQSVARALRDLKVDDERIHTSSRGELDAKGTDEASWALDRRVNIRLYD